MVVFWRSNGTLEVKGPCIYFYYYWNFSPASIPILQTPRSRISLFLWLPQFPYFYQIAEHIALLSIYITASIPRWGRSREGNGNPIQSSCLENPMDRGDWWVTVLGVAKSQTWLSTNTFTLGVLNFLMQTLNWKIHSFQNYLTMKAFPWGMTQD